METLRIDNTDIFLDDLGEGKGKIIIANTSAGFNYSYYWGAMGSSLKKFLCDINASYFVTKLCANDRTFCALRSARNIRRSIKDDMGYNLPWYKHLEFQKELREKIKSLEDCEYEHQFVDDVYSMVKSLPYWLIEDKYDRKSIEDDFKSVFSEPWHCIEKVASREAIFLTNLHKKLKAQLS